MKTMRCPVASGHVAGPGLSSMRRAQPVFASPRVSSAKVQRLAPIRVQEVEADPDAFEKRIKKMVKNSRVPKGDAKPDLPAPTPEAPGWGAAPAPVPKKTYDFTNETLYYEGPPHRGDLAVNIALGTTLVWLPLTAAAVARAVSVTYKFTDRRFSISTNAPWKTEQVDIAYQQVKGVQTVGRGIGLWGDMVVTLLDESKVEMRALDRFLELKKYILERRDILAPEYLDASKGADVKTKGMITAAELMGEEEPKGGKGFGKK